MSTTTRRGTCRDCGASFDQLGPGPMRKRCPAHHSGHVTCAGCGQRCRPKAGGTRCESCALPASCATCGTATSHRAKYCLGCRPARKRDRAAQRRRAAGHPKTCTMCDTRFVTRFPKVVTCSSSCRARHEAAVTASRTERRTCPTCSTPFDAQRSSQRRYCSSSCRVTGWQEGPFPRSVGDRSRRVNYRRRAQRHGVDYEPISAEAVFARDHGVCGLCSRPVDASLRFPHPQSATLDHIRAMARGGPHLYGNVQLAHLACNVAKGVGDAELAA